MKVKSVPEDFVVSEVSSVRARESGIYGLYILEKKGWNTPDALKGIAARAGLPYGLFSYGGRKDRHAHTSQYVTVRSRRDLSTAGNGYRFTRVGSTDRAMGPGLIVGNEFRIMLRSLSDDDVAMVCRNAAEALDQGFPNYFDDQRFGSMDPERGFIAERMLKGQWRGSVEIYLTSCRPDDPREVRDRRERMRRHWGDWPAMLDAAGDGGSALELAMLQLLSENHGAYVRALQMIPGEELSLFFSAYQSFLWNEIARRLVAGIVAEPAAHAGTAGAYLFYRNIPQAALDRLQRLNIPLPAAGARFDDETAGAVYARVLEERGIHPGRFNVRRLRQAFFRPAPRQVIVFPARLAVSEPADDELNPGRKRVLVTFFLPRGSYGTMLVKRLSVRAVPCLPAE
ncbi:MAG: tRNA pseudouridine(13) synthase TruD [Ignavibacteriales bacterium]